MKYIIIQNRKDLFYFFLLPLILYLPFMFFEEVKQLIFNSVIFLIIIFGLLLFYLTFNYMKTHYKKEVAKVGIYPYLLPSCLVLFLWLLMLSHPTSNKEGLSFSFDADKTKIETNKKDKNRLDGYANSDLIANPDIESDKLNSEVIEYFLPTNINVSMPQEFSVELRNRLREEAQKESLSSSDLAVATEFGNNLGKLMVNQDWEQIEVLVERFASKVPDASSIAANVLLLNGAPMDVIKSFLAKGATVSAAATVKLLSTGRLDDLKQLENFGISYSQVGPLNMSILDLALLNKINNDTFDFLLERTQDISRFKSEIKVDTLAIALIKAEVNSEFSPYLIQALISKGGGKITQQHVELLSSLGARSPDLAKNIMDLNPILSGVKG